MSMSNKVTIIAISTLLFFPQAILAVDEHLTAGSETDNEIHLSADLHSLLGQEMTAIENAMQDLVPAISSGEWANVISIAQKIRDSFIMKQTLSAIQREELHRVLPHGFIEMDQDFHHSAGMLAHAAEMKNADVVNFYFFKLNTACVACHAKYAGDRFPGLQKGSEARRVDMNVHPTGTCDWPILWVLIPSRGNPDFLSDQYHSLSEYGGITTKTGLLKYGKIRSDRNR